jgi:uncharacterized protein YjiS (DUF1127 family)
MSASVKSMQVHHGVGFTGALFAAVANIVSTVQAYFNRRRAMDELAQLDDRMLADIGLARGELFAVIDRYEGGANDNKSSSRAA